ncbi:universal stress protein [Tahibacter soli]|uniref:Universal stress protein n=1 Tax=Tahibacter soli TaxID=2983605 RepID=A0A9X3YHH0_9GAMM|nr:universal stress protein [Tahibacter soli]MDC8011672.1 universal stress protein [Tahibacter soli]
MQDILLPLTDAYDRNAACVYAAELAAGLGASLTALYAVQPFLGGPAFNSPGVIAEAVGYLLEQRKAAVEGAAPFLDWAQRRGVARALWETSDAPFARAVAAAASWHDIVVLQADADTETGRAAMLGEVLLTCGRPCIVVRGAASAPPRRIAVAWNGSVECVRAVQSSLGLLLRADEVVLLQSEPSERTASQLPRIDTYLKRHGVRPTYHPHKIGDRTPGESLLQAAQAAGADLMVMGAYGHSRFSEWVLGGATRHVLEEARLPVYLRH